jgi:hypothetical protein
MREELATTKSDFAQVIGKLQNEKLARLGLESNKQKYIMLKELMQNSETIQDNSFFENRRN